MAEVDDVQFQEPTGIYLYPLGLTQIAPGVHCLHNWYQDWGPNQQRLAAHTYLKQKPGWNIWYYGKQPLPIRYTTDWARNRIQEGLAKIGKGLVFAAMPSYSPYAKNAALLKSEFGFKLLGGKCYPNPGYAMSNAAYRHENFKSIYCPDGYQHWIHLWVKDLKGLDSCGAFTYGRPVPGAVQPADHAVFPNCCGLRLRWSAQDLKLNAFGGTDMNAWLAPCQIPTGEKFPRDKGWKRFALYKDFKWGINFDSPHVKGVQDCPHEFDLKKIEEWELAQPLPK